VVKNLAFFYAAFTLFIREMPGSNIGPETDYTA